MKYFITIIFAWLLFTNCGKKIEIQKEETPVLLVSAKSLNLAATENSSALLEVAANVEWTAASGQDWLKISATSGTGNATLTVSVTANTTGVARNASITVTGKDVAVQTVTVTQGVDQVTPSLSLSATSLNMAAAEGSSANFDITSNTSWTVASDQSWLSVATLSGTGNLKVNLTASANKAFAARNATITITAQGLVAQTITVSQAAAVLSVDAKPNWAAVTTDFQYTMTYIAHVSINSGVQTIQDGDEVAAFVGTECRGAATIVTAGTTKSFYLLIKGNQTSTETLTFKYYQKSSSHIFDLNLTKDFVANQAFGSLDVPFVFEVK
jgi:hypothetical protein